VLAYIAANAIGDSLGIEVRLDPATVSEMATLPQVKQWLTCIKAKIAVLCLREPSTIGGCP
jgi:hypothetical protein